MGNPRRTMVGWAAAALAGLSLAGCGSQQPNLVGACPDLDTERAVPTCTYLFDGREGLRLPSGPRQEPIGAVTRGAAVFVDGGGRKHRVDAASLMDPADRSYANTVYRATLSNGVVTDLTPVLRVTDAAILTHTFGGRILAGLIDTRQRDGSYTGRPTLLVLIQLESHARGNSLPGVIANADVPVRLNDGACIGALRDQPGSPLANDYTSTIALERAPGMHAPFADQLVLRWAESSSGMGDGFYPSVATAMGRDGIVRWRVNQHGNPTSGPTLTLRLAEGTINPC